MKIIYLLSYRRGGSFRPNPEGRIIENRKAEFYEPLGRTVRPNLTVRPKI